MYKFIYTLSIIYKLYLAIETYSCSGISLMNAQAKGR